MVENEFTLRIRAGKKMNMLKIRRTSWAPLPQLAPWVPLAPVSIVLVALLLAVLSTQSFAAADRPNILWITSEDHGPEMGCYGDKFARTPNVDALAKKGMLFKLAWSCAPVCAPARTTIITGMYPPSIGGQHMRSMVALPKRVQFYPVLLRKQGYYTTNASKQDYNVKTADKGWDVSSKQAHYKNRKEGQPFFAIFNSTVSHESKIRTRPHQQVADPAKVRLPGAAAPTARAGSARCRRSPSRSRPRARA